jgi:hypothetical protein
MSYSAPQISKSLHYNFAHVALPILALGNPKKLYKDLARDGGLKYLISIWEGLERRMEVSYSHEGLETEKLNFGERYEAFIIKMPAPRNVPEAFFICIVFDVKKKFLSKEVSSVRYFTLEFGKSPFDDSPEYHFCEWYGGIFPEHKNHGHFDALDKAMFMGVLIQTVNA